MVHRTVPDDIVANLVVTFVRNPTAVTATP
jgi:hypothetical protein